MKRTSNRVVVVGAGLGGIAAAIRLARVGFQVEVWDRNQTPGGKLQEIREGGYRWDTGPSLLTMPHVLRELFEFAGTTLERELTLERLSNTCRYFYSDGRILDEDEKFWQQPCVKEFIKHAEGIYSLSGEAFLQYPPGEWWKAFTWNNLHRLKHLSKVASFETLAQRVDRFFKDPHLRQLFYRYATYNGSSPYRTPAAFAIIPYVESHFGGWYVRGGMARIAEALARVAKDLGVVFHQQRTVSSYEKGVLRTEDGVTAKPDVVICNGDLIRASTTWLRSVVPLPVQARWKSRELSSSGYVLFLGVKGKSSRLTHHNISFSSDYPGEFEAIFEKKKLPMNPTIYVAITSKTDEGDAPTGGENWFVLVNAPARGDLRGEEAERYGVFLEEELRRRGFLEKSQTVEVRKILSPGDLSFRDLTSEGSLYGWASHALNSAMVRPPLRLPGGAPVYGVGGTGHPGGGIPLVLLSGAMVASQIRKDFFHR